MVDSRYLDVDWLDKNALSIKYFGLGFCQVKLNERERLHFYTDRWQKTVKEEVHDHRYDFVSTVVAGTFRQEFYTVTAADPGTHVMVYESCNPEIKAPAEEYPCTCELFHTQEYKAGEQYFMDRHTFHTVESVDAITYVVRGLVVKELAKVVFPAGMNTVCPFSVQVTREECLEFMRERLNAITG
jgi:hypothetical protein